jgi:PHD/YefM family antitoxin component YafN of YafNO toxin-antitoxin module
MMKKNDEVIYMTDDEIMNLKLADLRDLTPEEELARREADVEAGRSRLISPAEFWGNVEKAGF